LLPLPPPLSSPPPRYQFQYQWWIIEFEFFIFCLTAVCTLFPRIIPRLRPVALTFLASALVLVMDNINAIWCVRRPFPAPLPHFTCFKCVARRQPARPPTPTPVVS
jgi:hypothetical protein